jgi:hypothetical protein
VLREGVLADASVNAEIDALASTLGAEAAARHFTRWPQLGQFTVISPPGWETRITYQSEVNYLRTWVRDRSAWIDAQFPGRPAATPAPGAIASGATVTLASAAGQTIFYTTNGTDPRQAGGAVAAGSQNLVSGGSFTVPASLLLTARVKNGAVWGPPLTAAYVTGTPASATTLVISEFAFHPADPSAAETAQLPSLDADDFEFIELHNPGGTALDLTGAAFTEGIGFTFPAGTVIAGGEHLAVVKNPAAFALRHGTGAPTAGPFTGNLANGGETVVLTAADGSEIARLTYSDGWSNAADGDGYSLVLRQPGEAPASYSTPASWALGGARHGSPGAANGPVFSQEFDLWRQHTFSVADLAEPARSGPQADADGDGAGTLLEFALGSHPLDPSSLPTTSVSLTDNGLIFTFMRSRQVLDVAYTIETSADGIQWRPATVPLEKITETASTETMRAVLSPGTETRQFLRLRVTRTF